MKKIYQKITLKKILICSVIIAVFAAGVSFVRCQQEESRKKNDIVTIYSGDEPGVYVDVDCYPVLRGQGVRVEDKEMIQKLSEKIDGKVFSYLGSSKELEKKFENTSGGYYSHFSVYSKNNHMLYSFGYNGNYDGYIVSSNSYIYRLEDDTGLNEICDEIITLAKEQVE